MAVCPVRRENNCRHQAPSCISTYLHKRLLVSLRPNCSEARPMLKKVANTQSIANAWSVANAQSYSKRLVGRICYRLMRAKDATITPSGHPCSPGEDLPRRGVGLLDGLARVQAQAATWRPASGHSVPHATMSAKDATMSAKDATMSANGAAMGAKDAPRTRP